MSLYGDIPLITRLFPITMNADFVSDDEKRDSSGTFAFAAKKTMKNNVTTSHDHDDVTSTTPNAHGTSTTSTAYPSYVLRSS